MTTFKNEIHGQFKILKSMHFFCISALVAQENDWLDKLEKRLRKSPKSAADAEEISEELDVSITFQLLASFIDQYF